MTALRALAAPCPTCRNPDGSINTAWAFREGSCTFGCGARICHDEGGGFCRPCGDHSANEAECEGCGTVYADWDNGAWAQTQPAGRT